MTEQQQSNAEQAATADAYTEEYRRLWDATVATLTAAVRLNHPQHGSVDFSDFLASALGAVAANVGSGERITAGRPGSWESDLLAQLVSGTIGYDPTPEELAGRRTIPVVVRLNVAQLVSESHQDAPAEERAGMLPHLDDALQAIDDASAAENKARTVPAKDDDAATWNVYEVAEDARAHREQAAENDLRRRYAEAFEAYGQRFAAAVLDAAQGVQGLMVPVEVKAETDPEASWWDKGDTINPQEWDEDDDLAWRRWAAARQRVGLPTLDETPTEE